MPEGLKLIVTADTKEAERSLKQFATTAKETGTQAANSLSRGLNTSNAVLQKLPASIKPAIQGVSKLGDSIETLRAKLLAKQSFLINEKDIGRAIGKIQ